MHRFALLVLLVNDLVANRKPVSIFVIQIAP